MSESKAVFLSYASQDTEVATRICEALRAAGVEVWFDQSELVGGDAWDAKIRKQIADCVLFVPIISATTNARGEGYFRLEWKLAVDRSHLMAHDQAFLLPVVIDEITDAAARVPPEFRSVQWTRLPIQQAQGGPGGATPEKFAAHVKRLLHGGTAVQEPAATAKERRGAAPTAPQPRSRRSDGIVALVAVAVLAAVGAGWWLSRERAAAPAATAQKSGSEPAEPGETLAKVRRLRAKVDVTRADLEAASGMLELADKQHPNHAEIWAEWSLVDGRFSNELLDRSDSRLESMRQRAQRAIGLMPESPASRFAQASALSALNRSDRAARDQARALIEPLAQQAEVDPGVLVLLSSLTRDRKNPTPSFGYLDRLARIPGWTGTAHFEKAIALIFGERWAEAEVEVNRALAAEPAARFRMWKSYILSMWHGDMPGARQAIADLPAAMLQEDFPAAACFWIHLWSRDWERALGVLRALPRDYLDSGALSGPTGYFKGWVLARAGREVAAEAEMRSALEVVELRLRAKPNARSLLVAKALVQVALGEREAAERTRRLVVELYGEEVEEWIDIFLIEQLLPPEEAIARLARHAEVTAFITAARLRLDPYLDRLRTHPKFAELQARVDADPRLSPAARQKL